jgi:hypothetical protein
MLGAKAIGVTLPRRIVVASRCMNEAQVGGDPSRKPARAALKLQSMSTR